jgi:hypothetical protein
MEGRARGKHAQERLVGVQVPPQQSRGGSGHCQAASAFLAYYTGMRLVVNSSWRQDRRRRQLTALFDIAKP